MCLSGQNGRLGGHTERTGPLDLLFCNPGVDLEVDGGDVVLS